MNRKISNEKTLIRIIMIMSILVFWISIKDIGLKIGSDDFYFRDKSAVQNLYDFLSERYLTWTGRIIVEAFLVSFLKVDIIFWKVLMTTCYGLLIYATYKIGRIFVGINSINIILISVASLLPFFIIVSDQQCNNLSEQYFCNLTNQGVFWYTGSFNYFLPIVTLIVGIYLMLKLVYFDGIGKKEKIITVFLLIIISLINTSVEQIAIVWALFLFGIIVLKFKKNLVPKLKNFKIILLITVISAIFFLIFILAPGNKNRSIVETSIWMPIFSNLNIQEKMTLSIQYGMNIFIQKMQIVLILLYIIIASIHLMNRKKLLAIISITIVGMIILKILKSNQYNTALPDINSFLIDNKIGKKEILGFLFIVTVSVLNIIFAFENKIQKSIIASFGASIIINIMIIGFTPTVFASGIRIIFIPAAILILVLYISFSRLIQVRKSE